MGVSKEKIGKKSEVKVDHETRCKRKMLFRIDQQDTIQDEFGMLYHNYRQLSTTYKILDRHVFKVHFAQFVWVCLEIRDWEPQSPGKMVEFTERPIDFGGPYF